MSIKQPGTQPVVTTPPAQPGTAAVTRPEPPAVRRVRSERTHHGDTFVDDFAWLADKENPETISYLQAENAYPMAMTAGPAGQPPATLGPTTARRPQTCPSPPPPH